jgi:hypothetical protein
VSEEEQNAVIVDALRDAGLAEVYTDEDGHEVMRLTDEGASMARELGILDHSPAAHAPAPATDDEPESIPPLEFPGAFGTAVGAAMLGFEQALRSEPPPEIQAAEHVPERSLGGSDEGLVIEFPDDLERDR